jgi:ureidoglycolate amidohydrolase
MLEAIHALQRSGFRPKRSIELILFISEEPTRFGVGCLGSRMLSGTLTAEAARQLTDTSGQTLEHVRQKANMQGDLESVKLDPKHYSAFVELHIEQGPFLERAHRHWVLSRVLPPRRATIWLRKAPVGTPEAS